MFSHCAYVFVKTFPNVKNVITTPNLFSHKLCASKMWKTSVTEVNSSIYLFNIIWKFYWTYFLIKRMHSWSQNDDNLFENLSKNLFLQKLKTDCVTIDVIFITERKSIFKILTCTRRGTNKIMEEKEKIKMQQKSIRI